MEGKKIGDFERKRSHSVPILWQIEKVLHRRDDFEAVRFDRTEGSPGFPETRSSRNTTVQRERSQRRLSSGGLIRNQKKRHLKTAVMEKKQASQHEQRSRPRASTTGTITELHDDGYCRDTNLDLHANSHAHRRERSKSSPLPSLTHENYTKRETDQAEEIGCVALKQKQTSTAKSYEKTLHQRSLSLPTCLQYESEHSERKSGLLDTTNPSSAGPLYRDKLESVIVDFDNLSFISLQRSEQERKYIFSDLGLKRTRSLPCYLEISNQSLEAVESSVKNTENINFNNEFREDSSTHKTKKMKTQRSQSLPLTGSSLVDEVRVEKKMMKDEVSRTTNYGQDGCGLRPSDALGRIVLTAKEHLQIKRKHPKIRSKSLPLALDVEGEANMSPNLIKHIKQKSLQSHGRLHDVCKAKIRRRVKSLPFIYESFTEWQLLCEAQITHRSQTSEGCDPNQNDKSINKGTQGNNKGSIKQKAKLERARSLPLSLTGAEQQQSRISRIQEDLNMAIDIFFSHNDEELYDIGSRQRSKSLPNVLEEVHSLNFTPVVTKILEDNSDIPEISVAENNIYDMIDDVDSDHSSHNESKHNSTQGSNEHDKNGPNEESKSETYFECDPLHDTTLNMQQPNSVYPQKLSAMQRGFSVPCSFKMERIIEEPNEIENYETLSSCCIHGHSVENETNNDCKAESFIENQTKTNKPPIVLFDEETQATPEGNRQSYSHEDSLEKFNKIVSDDLASVQQLKFSKSSSGLHREAANGNLEGIKRLVERGDDVNCIDESGWPVLHAAVTTGNFDCGAWLIESGADLVKYTNFVIDEYRMLSRQVYQNY